jgi:hypothetical protein
MQPSTRSIDFSSAGSRAKFVCGGYEVPIENTQALMAMLTYKPRARARRPRGALGCGRPAVRRERSSSSSRSSGQDPGDGDDPPHPWRPRRDAWALRWADRASLVWRFRAACCRLHEIREGVDR